MPVILEPDDWPAWLGEVAGDPSSLLRPSAEGVLRLWPVSRAVNSVRNNTPDLLDRIDDPAAPPPSHAPPGTNPAERPRPWPSRYLIFQKCFRSTAMRLPHGRY